MTEHKNESKNKLSATLKTNAESFNNRLNVVDLSADGETDVAMAELVNAIAPRQYNNDEIGPNKKITLHFSLALAVDGAIIDENFSKAPVTYQVGDGNFLSGFERSLMGLKVGTQTVIRLESNDAFGEIKVDNFQVYPRFQFPADLELKAGLMISFSDAAGNGQPAVVKEYNNESVTMDFNHPLAGREIDFKVEILAIEAII